ncbi:hypothetical protein LWC08_07755 [Desulfobaculum bizertense]|uniref:hypothetical protein n=1 Tax=Desulfobaculum bizertense TaxID=376490 RepID=UPI001F21DD47|nr:hypothetical protein [Desulfobaculum bizertense]UIJ36645.1 hypothetical protein LWC08_07755 [Desulfobaculum bizertense]
MKLTNQNLFTSPLLPGVRPDGLLRMKAALKGNFASSLSDLLGIEYLVHWEKSCLSYFSTLPPESASTSPRAVHCPLGLRIIHNCKLDLSAAIESFLNASIAPNFVEAELFWPLMPACTEPVWVFRTRDFQHVIVGANSKQISAVSGLSVDP